MPVQVLDLESLPRMSQPLTILMSPALAAGLSEWERKKRRELLVCQRGGQAVAAVLAVQKQQPFEA